MASSPCNNVLSLLSLLSLLIPLSSSSTVHPKPTTTSTFSSITIPLSPISISSKSTSVSSTYKINPSQRINYLVSSSITRAHHLKDPHKYKHSDHDVVTKTPLFARSYGGYSISLSFGTPPQTLPLLMDTGSSLVWVPCTTRFVCTNCNFPNIDPNNITTFIPKSSSSVRILGCNNPKCSWLFGPDVGAQCQDNCPSGNCTQLACPAYMEQYGSGTTAGILLSETLVFPEKKTVNNFVVGCSILATQQPSGIVGFGRGLQSLPSQMGLKKFSYCLVSHRFDDDPVGSSDLVLVSSGSGSGWSSDSETAGGGRLSFTPFIKNIYAKNSAYKEYYYVSLRKITVGGKRVMIPYRYLVPGSEGNGGTIVDSGTTFTVMENEVYELVAREFETQMKRYRRANDVEKQSALRPCFNLSGEKSVKFPDLVFHFKGGGEMVLPLADYFSIADDLGSVVCMTIATIGADVSLGPSIILGNYQQQNFYLEYDLEKERLGFRKQICK